MARCFGTSQAVLEKRNGRDVGQQRQTQESRGSCAQSKPMTTEPPEGRAIESPSSFRGIAAAVGAPFSAMWHADGDANWVRLVGFGTPFIGLRSSRCHVVRRSVTAVVRCGGSSGDVMFEPQHVDIPTGWGDPPTNVSPGLPRAPSVAMARAQIQQREGSLYRPESRRPARATRWTRSVTGVTETLSALE